MTWLDSWLPSNLVIFFEVTICWAEVALVLLRLGSPRVDLAELQLWRAKTQSVDQSFLVAWLSSRNQLQVNELSTFTFFFRKKTMSAIPYWSSNLSKLMPVTVVVIIGTIPTITPLPLTISDPHGCRICPPSPGLLLPLWSGHWVISISIIMVACALQWMCLKVCAWEIVWQSAGLIR